MTAEEQKAYDEALRTIEEWRWQGKQGKTLDLSGQRLTTLPPELGRLTALTRLDLANNRLTTLPPEIGQLTALTQLFLINNQLTTLPPELGRLTALRELFLAGNPLQEPPLEVAKQGVATIRRYFADRAKSGTELL